MRKLRLDGVNALVLDVQRLARSPRATRTFDNARRFALRERLVLVAVVPARRGHASRVVRHSLRACRNHASGLRCATAAGSVGAAYGLARRNRLAAVFVAGPSGFARYADLPTVPRHILVVAKLDGRFDPWVWSDVIARARSSTTVDLGVAPQTSLSSEPVKEFSWSLSSNKKTGLTAPSEVATSNLAQRSLTLSWVDPATNVAGFRLYRGGRQVGTSSTTTFAYISLSCGTSYTLGVSAYDASGQSSTITKTNATTADCVDTTAPSVPTGLATSGLGQTTATLSWSPSSDDVGVAGYQLYVGGAVIGTTTGTSYAFTGLSCSGSYALGVAAYDAAGNTSAVATIAQQTQPCTGGAPPSTPTALVVSNVGQTSMTLSWDPSTSSVGVAGYQMSVNGVQVGTTASTTYGFSGLACGTSYTLGVTAVDFNGVVSGTASVSQATLGCADSTPPTTPTGLATSAVTQTVGTLSWTASTDNVGVTGYRLYRNGTQVGTATTTSYGFSGLTCGTSYTLGVAAVDAAGNASLTATTALTTTTCPDTTPPSTPTGLATSAVTQTSMSLSWTASTDNVGVAGYRLFLNGTQVGTSTSTGYSFTGLTCGTSEALGVAAYDAAGNVSSSAALTMQTAPCSGGGTATANVFVSSTGSNTAANCKRYSPAQADPGGTVCASFAKACSLAQGGDQVLVRNDGNYAQQALTYSDCPNATAAAPITFLGQSSGAIPAVGAAADAPKLNGSCTFDCYGVTLESEGTYTNGPNYVTLRNFRVNAYVNAGGNQTASSSPGTRGVGIVIDHVSAGAIYSFGTTNITVANSDFGNCYQEGTHPCMAAQSSDFSNTGSGSSRQAESGLYKNDTWHDYNANDSTNDHGECFFALDWTGNLTFDGDRFYNCVISGGIRLERIVNPPAGSLLTIQNTSFGTMYDHTPYSSGQRCEDITWGSNSGALSNVLIRYNTFAAGGGPFGSSGTPTSSFRIIANLVGQNPNTDTCENGSPATANYGNATVDHNVWVTGNAGTNSTHVASTAAFNALLVNPAGDSSMAYHLSNSTSVPNNYVPCASGDAQLTWDFEADPRPHDPQCDAGADEH